MTFVIKTTPLPGVDVLIRAEDQHDALEVLEALAPRQEITADDVSGPLMLEVTGAIITAFRVQPEQTITWIEGLLNDMRDEHEGAT